MTSEEIEHIQSILIDEGQRNYKKYGLRLGDLIRFTPTEVKEILERRCLNNEDTPDG